MSTNWPRLNTGAPGAPSRGTPSLPEVTWGSTSKGSERKCQFVSWSDFNRKHEKPFHGLHDRIPSIVSPPFSSKSREQADLLSGWFKRHRKVYLWWKESYVHKCSKNEPGKCPDVIRSSRVQLTTLSPETRKPKKCMVGAGKGVEPVYTAASNLIINPLSPSTMHNVNVPIKIQFYLSYYIYIHICVYMCVCVCGVLFCAQMYICLCVCLWAYVGEGTG